MFGKTLNTKTLARITSALLLTMLKIITKLDSLSDDGKIMTYGDGELTVDYMMAKSMKVASGSYIDKGKKVAMAITVLPGELDNENPDYAMPACTLSLEFKK